VKQKVVAIALAAASTTCVPSLGPGDALITSTRILGVRAEPAEARPGASVTFTALVASTSGTVNDAAIEWSFCTAPDPLTADNVVSNACFASSSLIGAGQGPSAMATTPSDGCSLFGPDTTSTTSRPRDPDATGGYYQPLRLKLVGADDAFELARIRCDLANADAAAARAFTVEYTLNQNPTLLPLSATIEGVPVALSEVPPGSRVTLEAGWPASAAETFAYYDPSSQTVSMQRESMQVAWYSTGGALDTEATGRSSSDVATTSDNEWVAPGTAGTVFLWVVLRDSRGGVAFATYDVVVQ
jgi:hypothetical protein